MIESNEAMSDSLKTALENGKEASVWPLGSTSEHGIAGLSSWFREFYPNLNNALVHTTLHNYHYIVLTQLTHF